MSDRAWTKERHEAARERAEGCGLPWEIETLGGARCVRTAGEKLLVMGPINTTASVLQFVVDVANDQADMLAEIERGWAEIEAIQDAMARVGETGKPADAFFALAGRLSVAQDNIERLQQEVRIAQAACKLRTGERDEARAEIARLKSAPGHVDGKAWSRLRTAIHAATHDVIGTGDYGTREELDREALGRVVREVWIAWAQEQLTPKASWLVPWEGLSEPDKEVDRRIGETLARIGTQHAAPALTEEEARAYHDIRAERARQIAKGRTPEKDDKKTFGPWGTWLVCLDRVLEKERDERARWVKVGSVAVAAIQSIDRRPVVAAPVPPEDVACRDCNGSGRDYNPADHSSSRCGTCDGKGKIQRKTASRRDIPAEVRPAKCPACGGHESVRAAGHDRDGFPHEQPCPECTPVEVRAPEMAVTTGEEEPTIAPEWEHFGGKMYGIWNVEGGGDPLMLFLSVREAERELARRRSRTVNINDRLSQYHQVFVCHVAGLWWNSLDPAPDEPPFDVNSLPTADELPAQATGADHVAGCAHDLWRCAAAWDPDARLLGDLTAREIAEVARRAMGVPTLAGSLARDLLDRMPHGKGEP